MTYDYNRYEIIEPEIPEAWQEVLLVLAQMEDGLAASEFQLEEASGENSDRVLETAASIPRAFVHRVRRVIPRPRYAGGHPGLYSTSYKLTRRAWRLLLNKGFFGEGLSAWLRKHGTVVAEMEWDSGGPGAGAGTVTVYQLGPTYHVVHDAGIDQYTSEREAIRASGILRRDPSTRSVRTRRSS